MRRIATALVLALGIGFLLLPVSAGAQGNNERLEITAFAVNMSKIATGTTATAAPIRISSRWATTSAMRGRSRCRTADAAS